MQELTAVIIAIIAAGPATTAALAARRTSRTVGRANGQGSLVQMVSGVIVQQAVTEERVVVHDRKNDLLFGHLGVSADDIALAEIAARDSLAL